MTDATSEAEGVVLRPGTPEDSNFIFSSWMHSYVKTAAAMGIPSGHYWDSHHALLERLLPKCEVVVATTPEAPEQILGYVVAQRRPNHDATVLHYVYVKHLLRRMGLGRRLLAEVVRGTPHYTHHTAAGAALARSVGAAYAPELLNEA